MDGCNEGSHFFYDKMFCYCRYKENVLLNQTYIFVCAKVFIFYNAVKPCEICATRKILESMHNSQKRSNSRACCHRHN